LSLALPTRIQGQDPDGGTWDETSVSGGVSSGGLSCTLRHPVVVGQCLQLSLPLPRSLRLYDLAELSYEIFAIVRNVTPDPATGARVGLMLLGKQPPKGYKTNPAARYFFPADSVASRTERRRQTRLEVPLNLRLRRLGPSADTSQDDERTIAENFGRGGARVLTAVSLAKGDLVHVEEIQGLLRSRAQVCNVYVGADRLTRVNLRFLDPEIAGSLLKIPAPDGEARGLGDSPRTPEVG
jgi:hypothetical protein